MQWSVAVMAAEAEGYFNVHYNIRAHRVQCMCAPLASVIDKRAHPRYSELKTVRKTRGRAEAATFEHKRRPMATRLVLVCPTRTHSLPRLSLTPLVRHSQSHCRAVPSISAVWAHSLAILTHFETLSKTHRLEGRT
ncbi:hypothetical protein Ddc_05415 [Ditylenchus destructor]|nr:hypothetical protein Ddc_05415 [Ditylenchus destructor]